MLELPGYILQFLILRLYFLLVTMPGKSVNTLHRKSRAFRLPAILKSVLYVEETFWIFLAFDSRDPCLKVWVFLFIGRRQEIVYIRLFSSGGG
jgi:hypothetical protein